MHIGPARSAWFSFRSKIIHRKPVRRANYWTPRIALYESEQAAIRKHVPGHAWLGPRRATIGSVDRLADFVSAIVTGSFET